MIPGIHYYLQSEEKSNGTTKSTPIKKERKEKIPSSPSTRIPRDLMTLPRELSASPPGDSLFQIYIYY